jgi:hypothetical protein
LFRYSNHCRAGLKGGHPPRIEPQLLGALHLKTDSDEEVRRIVSNNEILFHLSSFREHIDRNGGAKALLERLASQNPKQSERCSLALTLVDEGFLSIELVLDIISSLELDTEFSIMFIVKVYGYVSKNSDLINGFRKLLKSVLKNPEITMECIVNLHSEHSFSVGNVVLFCANQFQNLSSAQKTMILTTLPWDNKTYLSLSYIDLKTIDNDDLDTILRHVTEHPFGSALTLTRTVSGIMSDRLTLEQKKTYCDKVLQVIKNESAYAGDALASEEISSAYLALLKSAKLPQEDYCTYLVKGVSQYGLRLQDADLNRKLLSTESAFKLCICEIQIGQSQSLSRYSEGRRYSGWTSYTERRRYSEFDFTPEQKMCFANELLLENPHLAGKMSSKDFLDQYPLLEGLSTEQIMAFEEEYSKHKESCIFFTLIREASEDINPESHTRTNTKALNRLGNLNSKQILFCLERLNSSLIRDLQQKIERDLANFESDRGNVQTHYFYSNSVDSLDSCKEATYEAIRIMISSGTNITAEDLFEIIAKMDTIFPNSITPVIL